MAETPEILLAMGPEELMEWVGHPTTRKIRKWLQECKASQVEQMAWGASLNLSSLDQTALQTAKLVGVLEGQDLILTALHEAEEFIKEQLGEEA